MRQAGLCDDCRHRRTLVSDRGSVFVRCERAKSDPRYPKYPPLPVWRCAGHEAEATGSDPEPPPSE